MRPLQYLLKHIPFRKKPLLWDHKVGNMNVQMFKKENILQIVKSCPDGSRILIDPNTWIEVHHGPT